MGRAALPVAMAVAAGAVLLLALGRDPVAFGGAILRNGLTTAVGLEQTIIRMAPLLLMGTGFIVAFQAGLWNIGGDGQFLMAAALVGGLGPPLVASLPVWGARGSFSAALAVLPEPRGRSCPRS